MIAREEWSESNVQQCAIRQKDILKEITLTIKPGGYLIYSTCTFNPSENENIALYLMEALEMKPVKINGDSLLDWDEIDDGRVIGWRAFPDKVEGEGLSVFVFQKEGAAHAQGSNKKKKVKKISLLKEIELEQDYYAIELKEKVVALNDSTYSMMGELIKNKLFIKSVGLQVGSHIKGKFIPDHEMVLSPFLKSSFTMINLTHNEAIKYLRGEVFPLEIKEKGWVIACYQGSQLGWLKSMRNRWNNYFPKYYRIRKDL